MIELYKKVINNYESLKYALLEAQTFDEVHYGFPDIYYTIMETDYLRVNQFVKVFEQYNFFKDQVVCEAGIGTLALSKYYLPFVKKAYLIENNPNLQSFIKKKIFDMGFSHKVELIFEDALKVKLPQKVDALIGELMSIFCANEFQIQIFKHLRQFLKPEGKMVPEKIINIAQICEAEFKSGVSHYPLSFTRHLPTLITLPKIVNEINLKTIEKKTEHFKIELDVINPGNANAILMSSHVHLSDQYAFTGTDSLMPPTVCRLKNNLIQGKSQKLSLNGTINYGTHLDNCIFEIKNI